MVYHSLGLYVTQCVGEGQCFRSQCAAANGVATGTAVHWRLAGEVEAALTWRLRMPKTILHAILFVPSGPSAASWLATCTEYAVRRGYQIAYVATIWDDVMSMIRAGRATIKIGRAHV